MRGTPETIRAAKVAKEKGAKVISLFVEESEMTSNSHVSIKYESLAEEESRIENVNSTIALHLAFYLLDVYENYLFYGNAIDALAQVDELYRVSSAKLHLAANSWAIRNKHEEVIHVLGGGSFGWSCIHFFCM